MSSGPQWKSRVTRIVESMPLGEAVATRQVAERMGLDRQVVSGALSQRSQKVRDVVKVRGGFMRVAVPAKRSRAPLVQRLGSDTTVGVGAAVGIVGPRTSPPFRAWQPAVAAGPRRPGADDYRQIPSLYGGARVAYRVGAVVDTSAPAAEPIE